MRRLATHIKRIAAPITAVLLWGSATTPLALAQSGTWLNTGTTSSLWSTTSNWVGGTVPGVTSGTTVTGTTVFNSAVGTYGTLLNPITIDAGRTLNVLEFQANSGGYTIGTLAGGTLAFANGGSIISGNTATNEAITINAPLRMLGSGSSLDLVQNATGTFTFGGPIIGTAATSGTQTLTLRGNSGSVNNFVAGNITNGTSAGVVRLSTGGSTSWTLSGTSTFGGNMLINSAAGYSITNTGSIAVGSAAGAGQLINSGIFDNKGQFTRAAGAGTFEINGANAVLLNSGTMNLGISFQVRSSGSVSNSGVMSTDTFGVGTAAGSAGVATPTFVNSGTLTIVPGSTVPAIGRENYGIFVNNGGSVTAGVFGLHLGLSGGATYSGTSAIVMNGGSFSLTDNLNMRADSAANNQIVELNLNSGTFSIGGGGRITTSLAGSGTNKQLNVNFNGGTLRSTGDGTTGDFLPSTLTAVTLGAGGGTINLTTVGVNRASANLTGVGGLTKTGSGTLFLTGTNSYAGRTNVNAGTLVFSSTTALYSGNPASWTAANITTGSGASTAFGVGAVGFTSANLDTFRTLATSTSGFLPGSSFGIDTTGTTFTYASSMTDANGGANPIGFTKAGGGTLALTGTNTYTGRTRTEGGVLVFSSTAALYGGTTANWTASNLTTSSGATTAFAVSGPGAFTTANLDALRVLGTATTGFLAGSSFGIDTTGTSFTYGSAITNAGANAIGLTKVGSGTLTLTGTNTYTGRTRTDGGVLVFSSTVALYGGTTGNWTASNLTTGSGATTAFAVSGPGAFTSANLDTLRVLGTATTGFLAGSSFGIDTTGTSFTYNSAIANPGGNAMGLAKLGSGTLTLSGSNTYTGTTAINNGTLRYGANDVVLDTGVVSVVGAASGTSTYDLAGFSDTIGSLTLGGANASSLAQVTTGTGTLAVNSVTYDASNNPLGATISGGLSFYGSNRSIAVGDSISAANDLTISATLGQGGDLTKTGAGNLLVSGSLNAAGGSQIINSGAGVFAISGPLVRNGTLTLVSNAGSGGMLVSGTVSQPSFPSGNSFTLSGGGTGTVSGPILNVFQVAKSGTGTWYLTGSSAYGSPTNINAGVLNVQNSSAMGTGVATVTAGAALELQGGISVANALNLSGTGVGDTGGLRSISGNNTYSGTVTLNAASRINSDAGTLTLDVASGNAVGGGFNLTFGGAGNVVVADPIGIGVGQLIKDGAGTLRLTGANTYTGTTNVNAGTLQIGNNGTAGSLSGSSAITGSSGAMLVFNRIDSYGGNFSNTIGGDLAVRLSAGTLTLAGNNSYTGGIELTSGLLSLGSASAIGSTGTIAFSGGTMQFTSSNTTDYSSRFSTAGSQAFNIDTNGQNVTLATGLAGTGNTLAKIGTGTLSLTGSNAFSGGSAINAGVLSLGNANTLGSAGTISFGGGTMQFTASNTTDYSSRFSTANSQSFNFDTNGQNVTFATAFQGTGSELRKAGTGLLTLSANSSTIAGAVTVDSGTLLNTGTLSAGGASVSANSTLRNQGDLTLTGDVSAGVSGAAIVNSGQFLQSGYRNLIVRSTASVTNSGTMGFGGFFLGGGAGAITEVATFANNAGGSFSSGDTGIGGANFATFTNAGGTYVIGSGLTLGRSNGVMTAGTTALTVTSGTVTAGSGGAIALSISGTVSNATAEINLNGGLFSAGRGITTALGTGTNNALLVNFGGGTLRGTGANAILLPSSLTAVNLNAGGATIDLGVGITNTIAAALTGAGGLTKTGSGVLQMTGANSYAGLTSVDAGTLRVNGLLGVGGVSVASNALLAGSGTIGGPVSILAGGIVGPGNSPGTLTVNDAFSLAGSSILDFELNAADTTVGGGINDLITGVTNLTLGGFLDITGSGDWTTLNPGTSWRLFNYTGTLTDNGLAIRTAPTLAAGQSLQISTATANQVNVIVVPEPNSIILAGVGTLLAGWSALRRRT